MHFVSGRDFSWVLLSYGMWLLYHFGLLEAFAVASLANLNSMLCPAVSDPFRGPNWRLWAIGHQFVLCLLAGKLFSLVGAKEPEKKDASGDSGKVKES